MNDLNGSFRKTWLWRQAFQNPRSDSTIEEQEFFKTQYLSIRERAAQLVSRIASDLPGLTVHDISHLDALWDTASSVAEGAVNVNTAEAFVLGVSILLHDAAMSLAAYPGGLAEISKTVAWKDAVARLVLAEEESNGEKFSVESPPDNIIQRIVPDVLRRLHAERAEELAEQAWLMPDGSQVFLVEDSDLRQFYGPTIGQIAHSHWWPVQKIEHEFSEDLGALSTRTHNKIDRIKLACLLRVSDALHLDSRRAPRFLRAITSPGGISAQHWSFQERLARPHIELDAVVFTTGQPFGREDAEAWWLAYDTLNAVDRELRDVDLLLLSRGREVLKARRVKGAGSPEILARTVKTKGWRPVDARLQVSDVPRIVETLGGSKLYGNDPTMALRELIQNAADAVQARRKFQKRASDWGSIEVSLVSEGEQVWLAVEDNGIGMSEQVLTGPLLDFGVSFWRSSLALEEFPGLTAAGMHAIGRFGIGFFSVFMLGPVVRVYSRRFDKGVDTGRLLEFRGGTSSRPIMSPCLTTPVDGGTRVEVLLKHNPIQPNGLLFANTYDKKVLRLADLVAAISPNLDVELKTKTQEQVTLTIKPGDWLNIGGFDLIHRLDPLLSRSDSTSDKVTRTLMQRIEGQNGEVFGRAYISPSSYLNNGPCGWVTISGLRAARLQNVAGILIGEAVTASRNSARPLVPSDALAKWATKQAELIVELTDDEERHALSAEVVLECGGTIGDLKFIKFGNNWMTTAEFSDHLRSVDKIFVLFDGEIEYDEDSDDVHPKEFREEFEPSQLVGVVRHHNGTILKIDNADWPSSMSKETGSHTTNLASYARKILTQIWDVDLQEDDEEHAVGWVRGFEITRTVTVFRRTPDDDDQEA